MKKLLSLLLVVCFLLTLGACAGKGETEGGADTSSGAVSVSDIADEIYADKRTYTTDKGADARNLNNTAYKLTVDKELNVLYFGGSITEGAGSSDTNSWSELTTKWLKETFPNATINETNTAIGGQGSYFALFRAERDVLPYKPDLLFVEFAINDRYQGFSKEKSTVLMESLIRKINTELPQTDIVIVLTTDQNQLGTEFETLKAHKEVAEYYGIPVINVGDALKEELDKTGKEWSDYVGDIVHPNDAGHKVYADTVTGGLKSLLPEESSSIVNHSLPEKTYISNIVTDTKTLKAEDIEVDENWRVGKGSSTIQSIAKYEKALIAREEGATLTFEFEGTTFGLVGDIRRNCNVTLTIDSKEEVKLHEKDATNEVERYVFDNLADGKHTVTIKYNGPGYFSIGAIFIG